MTWSSSSVLEALGATFYDLVPGGKPAAAPGTGVGVHTTPQVTVTPAAAAGVGAGDAIVFDADQPHTLRNPGNTEARAYQVTVNAETPPRWHVPADSRRIDDAG